MLAAVVGWFCIAVGVLFVWKPGLIRRRLQKKGIRFIRRYAFVLAVFFGFLLISTSLKIEGMTAKVIMIVGFLAILKGFFYLRAKSAEKIIAWSSKQPLWFYRLCASVYIILGTAILLVRR